MPKTLKHLYISCRNDKNLVPSKSKILSSFQVKNIVKRVATCQKGTAKTVNDQFDSLLADASLGTGAWCKTMELPMAWTRGRRERAVNNSAV